MVLFQMLNDHRFPVEYVFNFLCIFAPTNFVFVFCRKYLRSNVVFQSSFLHILSSFLFSIVYLQSFYRFVVDFVVSICWNSKLNSFSFFENKYLRGIKNLIPFASCFTRSSHGYITNVKLLKILVKIYCAFTFRTKSKFLCPSFQK